MIWIDGDGVPGPVKEVMFKAAARTGMKVVFVANRFHPPVKVASVSCKQVPGGLDVADDYIAENCGQGDLVISLDIPLAARVTEAGGSVLTFRGEVLDAENVAQRLAVRDRMDELRGGGVMTGGPAPFGPKDKQKFANALDRWLSRNR